MKNAVLTEPVFEALVNKCSIQKKIFYISGDFIRVTWLFIDC